MSQTLFEGGYLEKAGFISNRSRTIWTHSSGATITKKGEYWIASFTDDEKHETLNWMKSILHMVFCGKPK